VNYNNQGKLKSQKGCLGLFTMSVQSGVKTRKGQVYET